MIYMEQYKSAEATNRKATSLGTFFGQEARKLFPNLVTVNYDSPRNMVKYTNQLIEGGFENIAEASFLAGDLFCSCDIFRVIDKAEKTAEVYEVKSTTDYTGSQIKDLAFQVYILTILGWKITDSYIVTVNSSYKNTDGTMDINNVYTKNLVTPQVSAEQVYMPDRILHVRDVLGKVMKEEPVPKLGDQCKNGFDCPYLDYCVKSTDADIFNLGSVKFSTKVGLYNSGVRTYQNIIDMADDFKISHNSVIQAKAHISSDEYVMDKEKIADFIQSFTFPLYFLDFESFQMAMPVWKDTAAYQQIPFQYSLHKMKANGKLSHMEFIGEPGQDPRRAIAESLCENIKRKGTILAYNSSFEKTRLRELAALFPDLKSQLLRIEARVEDLMVPFAKRWFYSPAQNGSYSIKAVLPALYPNDPRLDYHKLDIVHNGTEAMTEYCNLESYSEEDRAITEDALLKYCELDTYALVMVYEFLRQKIL